MQIERLRSILDSPTEAETWLRSLGIEDPRTAYANLQRLGDAGLPSELIAILCDQFAKAAPQLADVDMALNNLERFLLAARNPLSTASLFDQEEQALPDLLQLFSTSQDLSDQLCADPESFSLLRTTEGRPVAREVLVDELLEEVRKLDSEQDVMAALRRFKRRETLRIAYGDIVLGNHVSQITRQISYVADAVVEGALDYAHRAAWEKSRNRNGSLPRRLQFVVLALGKLGGLELNYSSDIDLVLLFQSPTAREGEAETLDYCNRVSQALIRLLSEKTALGFAYRVDMRLRPEGRHGAICCSTDSALAYYDVRGRTWERQAHVKARPIAGDLVLGQDYLARLEPWIYRRYLSFTDIAGIKGLKRRIEDRAKGRGVAQSDVKTGHGGIRDIEFVIQFLQLLNGGILPRVRTSNTLEAIERLEQVGCLTHRERTILEDNYCFLRKLEHRLQIMFDLQTHTLPDADEELVKVARRMGYVATQKDETLGEFRSDYQQRTQQNRGILDHLLHEAFGEDAQTEPEVDLVNSPDPQRDTIDSVLGHYPFQDPQVAHAHLMSLATESIPFLSSRRCRLFLSAIAPRLLYAIAQTPDPDATLVTLTRVSDSLGGKAALWELFSSNHATLNLYVTLCATCPYLSGILTSNPGMIDELTDSLVLDSLPSQCVLQDILAELTRGAEDLDPILHSFKHAQHLRVGVRDIVGKDDIEATHRALSDIAETCLREIVSAETSRLREKLGEPTIGNPAESGTNSRESPWYPESERVGEPCEFIVLALGKLGGQEPNYHSDLDLVFLYEAEGQTVPVRKGSSGATSNGHFFSELGQRIIKVANRVGPYGRLYEIDARLRPTGRSGSLAMPLDAFVRYFERGDGQLWERQSLCKARVVYGSERVSDRANRAVAAAIYCRPWQSADAAAIRSMRMKLQATASPRNLKRSSGGTMDTEFIVQMLQLKHGNDMPEVRVPGTLAGLRALEKSGCVSAEDAQFLQTAYRFQRSTEARIRLMESVGRHEFPDDEKDLAKLAVLLGYANSDLLAKNVKDTFTDVRARFTQLFDAAEKG